MKSGANPSSFADLNFPVSQNVLIYYLTELAVAGWPIGDSNPYFSGKADRLQPLDPGACLRARQYFSVNRALSQSKEYIIERYDRRK